MYVESRKKNPDIFLECLLTYSGLPKFRWCPSLSVIPYWELCNYLYNYLSLFLITTSQSKNF